MLYAHSVERRTEDNNRIFVEFSRDETGNFRVEQVLVIKNNDIRNGNKVACEEIGTPLLAATDLLQILKREDSM